MHSTKQIHWKQNTGILTMTNGSAVNNWKINNINTENF